QDLEDVEAVVGKDGVKRDVVLADVAGDLRVVDDDEERHYRDEDEREDFEELAKNIAVEDVRERDVEAVEQRWCVVAHRGCAAAPPALCQAEQRCNSASQQSAFASLRTGIAIGANEQIDPESEQNQIRAPHPDERGDLS